MKLSTTSPQYMQQKSTSYKAIASYVRQISLYQILLFSLNHSHTHVIMENMSKVIVMTGY